MDPEQQQQLLLFTEDEEPFHKFTESDLDFLLGEESNYSSNYVNGAPNKFYIFSYFFPLNQLFAHSYVFSSISTQTRLSMQQQQPRIRHMRHT